MEGREIYAIIETGGKQYRVAPGQIIDVDKLDVAEGKAVELERVLLVADGGKVTIGNPLVSGAKVMATSQGEGKGKKLLALKFKAKTRYIRKIGHRQDYTRLAIERIVT